MNRNWENLVLCLGLIVSGCLILKLAIFDLQPGDTARFVCFLMSGVLIGTGLRGLFR